MLATITDSLIGAATTITAIVVTAAVNNIVAARRAREIKRTSVKQSEYAAAVAKGVAEEIKRISVENERAAKERDIDAREASVRTNAAINVVQKLVDGNLTDAKRRLASRWRNLPKRTRMTGGARKMPA